MVDMTSIQNVINKLTNKTKLIWIETPSNPTLKIIDIEGIVHAIRYLYIINNIKNIKKYKKLN